jgi:chaperonin GroES
MLDEDELNTMAATVKEHIDVDKASREEWEKQYETALALALQLVEKKTYPIAESANIKYPLVTTACVNFNARAYPALINGVHPVTGHVIGKDEQGLKEQKAVRISQHMSWQLLYQMEEWEEEQDLMMMVLPLIGTAYKKTYYDPSEGRNFSRLVLPNNLIVNYYHTDKIEKIRKSELIPETKNEILTQQRLGIYRNISLDEPKTGQNMLVRKSKDKSEGMSEPTRADSGTPYTNFEYHGWYDLDGDGYEEPYLIVFNYDHEVILRVAPRFVESGIETNADGEIVRITPVEFYTKYIFLPNPASWMGIGFGQLLGPLNSTVNSAINMLLDSGKWNNLQSGFLGKGIRMAQKTIRFAPGDWKVLPTVGGTLKDNILPLPIREPSPVLFDLLSLMITAGERLSTTTDFFTGQNPGQNQKATTTQAVRAEGLKVFNAIFKRIHRAFRQELKKLYKLNAAFLEDAEYFAVLDGGGQEQVTAADYAEETFDVYPAADPNMALKEEQVQRSMMILQTGMTTGKINVYYTLRQMYEAMGVPNLDKILPDPDGQGEGIQPPPPQPDPDKMAALQLKEAEMNMKDQREQIDQAIDLLKLESENDAENVKNAIKLLEVEVNDSQKQRELDAQAASEARAAEQTEGATSNEG